VKESLLPGGETLRLFTAAADAGVLVVDEAGNVLLSNAVAEGLLGRSRAELVGTSLGLPLTPAGVTEVDVVHPGGVLRSVDMQVTATRWEGGRAYVIALNDAGMRKRAARRVAESEERFEAVFEHSPIGLALLDRSLRFNRVNGALRRILGYKRAELEGVALGEIAGTSSRPAGEELLPQGRAVASGQQLPFVTKDGRERVGRFDVARVSHSADAARTEVLVSVQDITEHRYADARMVHLALHDELTGLANRTLVMERLQLAQARAERSGGFVGLLFIDLDNFKEVNDSLGHAAGDALLIEVARRLGSVLRPADTAARFGGDEFVVCCEDLGTDATDAQRAALRVVGRIVEALGEPVRLDGRSERTTASIGVALVRGSQQTPDIVLRNADQAMYRAKQQGRDRFELFDEALQTRADTRNAFVDELALALERDELVVHYQPITDLNDGRIMGAEALVRWNHPSRGLLLPPDFLGVAEETRLIVPIGDWVLDRACRDLAKWRREIGSEIMVTVNASARQLGDHELAASIDRALASSGLEAGLLEIELTETMLIDANEATLSELEGLRKLGVHVGLDDFGTGYASLTYLRRLPLDFVKVDGSFVAGLGQNRDNAIVAAIVYLAHALNLQVIAEGVESRGQQRVLAHMGCNYAQGWHFGRPRASDEFSQLLQAAV
jgi:diguanylate cyclase (GGDEF)-like protein/PAS domain S-box-containing protein